MLINYHEGVTSPPATPQQGGSSPQQPLAISII